MENSIQKVPLCSIVLECLWTNQIHFILWSTISGSHAFNSKGRICLLYQCKHLRVILWVLFCSLLRLFNLAWLWGETSKERKKKYLRFCGNDYVWPTFSFGIYLFTHIFAFKEWKKIFDFKNSLNCTQPLCQSNSLNCDYCLDPLWS